jgi:hypothetical protein
VILSTHPAGSSTHRRAPGRRVRPYLENYAEVVRPPSSSVWRAIRRQRSRRRSLPAQMQKTSVVDLTSSLSAQRRSHHLRAAMPTPSSMPPHRPAASMVTTDAHFEDFAMPESSPLQLNGQPSRPLALEKPAPISGERGALMAPTPHGLAVLADCGRCATDDTPLNLLGGRRPVAGRSCRRGVRSAAARLLFGGTVFP